MTTAVLTTTASTRTTRREPLGTIDMAASSRAHARPASSTTTTTTTTTTSGRGRGRRPSARLNSSNNQNNNAKEEESPAVRKKDSGRAVNVNGGLNSTTNGGTGGEKKRKAGEYDEDADGFQFTRVASKKARPSLTGGVKIPEPVAEEPAPKPSPRRGRPPRAKTAKATTSTPPAAEGPAEQVKKPEATTRTTRQTRGNARRTSAEPATTTATRESESPFGSTTRKRDDTEPFPPLAVEKKRKKGRPPKSKPVEAPATTTTTTTANGFISPEPTPVQAGTTKIALPLADTPVIRRNKEMRAEKAEKGQRRSSLGMRGRRASSLIDSGASNALPHREVDTKDFYKHIASEGIPEPRRMRQLLTWCATRAMGEKPSGSRSDDESARLAARVIQEEMLKDFANVSELSDWFGREDKEPPAVVVKKPNPRNIQNAEKIKELEEQIQRLQQERNALNALLKEPSIPRIRPRPRRPEGQPPDQTNTQPLGQNPSSSSTDPSLSPSDPEPIDTSLLDPSQRALLASLDPSASAHPQQQNNEQSTDQEPSSSHQQPPPQLPSSHTFTSTTLEDVTARLARLTTSLAPTLDSFAAGVHDIELYRSAADSVSSKILRICAQRLEERDARNTLLSRIESEGSDSGGGGDGDEGGGGEEDGKRKGRVRIRRERPQEDISAVLGALSRVERRFG